MVQLGGVDVAAFFRPQEEREKQWMRDDPLRVFTGGSFYPAGWPRINCIVRVACGPTNGSEMFLPYYNDDDGGAKSPCGVKIENL